MDNHVLESEQRQQQRINDILSFSLGEITQYLQQPELTDLMVNSDGRLWIEHLHEGRRCTDKKISPYDAERIIKLIANQTGTLCNHNNPILSAELREYNARFQGMLPPVVVKPCFTIRKHALKIFSLADYVTQGVMSAAMADHIKSAIARKKNLLIAGGTGSGKTTLANAVLAEIAQYNDRLVIIEDTQELQCSADDHVSLRVTDDVNMTDLLKSTMRLRPDRIIVGEVRDGSALTFLKAANTGHPGCMTTIHANSVAASLNRLEQLIQEVVPNPPRHLIGETVDLVVYIEREGTQRRVKEIGMVNGYHDQTSRYVIDGFEE